MRACGVHAMISTIEVNTVPSVSISTESTSLSTPASGSLSLSKNDVAASRQFACPPYRIRFSENLQTVSNREVDLIMSVFEQLLTFMNAEANDET
jgi:hypothetical protein